VTFDDPPNAGKHVTSTIACAHHVPAIHKRLSLLIGPNDFVRYNFPSIFGPNGPMFVDTTQLTF